MSKICKNFKEFCFIRREYEGVEFFIEVEIKKNERREI